MANTKFQGNVVKLNGDLPLKGSAAPDFTLVKSDLSEVKLSDLKGKTVVLNIFPSIDTGVCAASVRTFNKEVVNTANTIVLAVSADLPFASGRFCSAEGIENVHPASVFRNAEFAKDYGILIAEGSLKGLLARAVVIIDPKGNISYTELVPEITQEPNYQTAINSIV